MSLTMRLTFHGDFIPTEGKDVRSLTVCVNESDWRKEKNNKPKPITLTTERVYEKKNTKVVVFYGY